MNSDADLEEFQRMRACACAYICVCACICVCVYIRLHVLAHVRLRGPGCGCVLVGRPPGRGALRTDAKHICVIKSVPVGASDHGRQSRGWMQGNMAYGMEYGIRHMVYGIW